MKRLAFSDDMMRAIAAGEKTMTRRPEKRNPVRVSETAYGMVDAMGNLLRPRIRTGDLVAATCAYAKMITVFVDHEEHETWYRFRKQSEIHWDTSRIMPAVLAPFVLRITEVRAEKLGDITPEDARREGAVQWFAHYANIPMHAAAADARECFAELWSHVYGPNAWMSDRDSWVWVYGFEIAEKR